jgi:hypothetical protein
MHQAKQQIVQDRHQAQPALHRRSHPWKQRKLRHRPRRGEKTLEPGDASTLPDIQIQEGVSFSEEQSESNLNGSCSTTH